MFESISEKFQTIFRKLGMRGRLTEKNIQEGLREVRLALLEADVHYKVVKDFMEKVSARAVGQEVIKSVTPAQQIIKIVHDALAELMGPADSSLPLDPGAPSVIMMVGLQGTGKTTTCAKLARYLAGKGKQPCLVAADLQRPAAVEQLVVLGKQIAVPVYSEASGRPVRICERSVGFAREQGRNVVVLDTAGRLHIDEPLMQELREIAQAVSPRQVLLVVDAMTGQDAVQSAKQFQEKLGIDGVILTKLDGDARGGAAMSVRAVTGKPIKFVGVGEKLEGFEEFHPDRMASRILGMGDVVSLVERAQAAVDQEKAAKTLEKMRKDELDLDDMLGQLEQVRKMGPLKEILGMIPGLGSLVGKQEVDEKQFGRIEAILRSMTRQERAHPELIDGSRRARISRGSGTTAAEVNSLLRQFRDMKKMFHQITKLGGVVGGKKGPPGPLGGGKGLPPGMPPRFPF